MIVIRARLPRDRSFLYVRFGDGEILFKLIRRRYWSKKRVVVMRFRDGRLL
jgi:hypothetical protein